MISKKEVEKISKLSRIELSEQEIEKYQKDISSILEYVDKLKEVDVFGLEPTSHSVDVFNVFREDEPECRLSDKKCEEKKASLLKKLIEVAPYKKNGFVKTKAVF